jgi:GT2 family glycosyltransferase
VIPNLSGTLATGQGGEADGGQIDEMVFFGRLEERKGLRVLFEALSLARDSLGGLRRVTLLGRDTIDSSSSASLSHLASASFENLGLDNSVELSLLTNYSRSQAIDYLSQSGRITVIPSLVDNSPNTVLECLAAGVRFIVADTGGAPELIRAEDHDILFKPTASHLARKLTAVLERGFLKTSRPSASVGNSQANWLGLHLWMLKTATAALPQTEPLDITICITHFERPALLRQLLDSIQKQNYSQSKISVVLVDDGSSAVYHAELAAIEDQYFRMSPCWTLVRTANVYLGEARNTAVHHALTPWLLFMDDDDVLKPSALRDLSEAAQRSSVDGLSTFLHEFAGDEVPHLAARDQRMYWFLGNSRSVGLFRNSFGSGNIFIKRSVFDAVGGFSTFREVGAEDWEFWTKVSLQGFKMQVLPQAVVWTRSEASRKSMVGAIVPAGIS